MCGETAASEFAATANTNNSVSDFLIVNIASLAPRFYKVNLFLFEQCECSIRIPEAFGASLRLRKPSSAKFGEAMTAITLESDSSHSPPAMNLGGFVD